MYYKYTYDQLTQWSILMYVYKITNTETGDFYIGKTINDINVRLKSHIWKSESSDTHLARAIKKYGSHNFQIELLQKYESQQELNEGEVFWISKLSPHYNMTSGGDGGDTSKSEKYQNYMALRSILISGEANPFYGKKHSEETKKKISLRKTGNKLSKEHKEKISTSLTGRKMDISSVNKIIDKNSKIWYLITPSGDKITVKNLSEYCRNNNLDQRNMCKMYNGLQKTSKGYTRDYSVS